ncbi:uncharacterized protein LODBEIA_P16430 [Lodderomyces beijingensis]|uniref:Tubulin-specific chaperone A n=1 Tax=Lodderomyces beijingensis TaxID=1775926 RepID=A0ABP0ZGX4_9ASCO
MPTQLQIKVDALKRVIKEEKLYRQEVAEQDKYVAQMKANNADEYEIKKQVEVLEESQRMVPVVGDKIKELKQSLKEYLGTYTGEEDTSEAKSLI